MMDMPMSSTGSSQQALTKPGALGTRSSLRSASASRAGAGILDADGGYHCVLGPGVAVPGE